MYCWSGRCCLALHLSVSWSRRRQATWHFHAIACVGPAEHPELAIRIMKKGYPVYTEKPQSLDSSNSFHMADVSNTTRQLCSIAYKKRYATVFDRTKKWMESFPADRLRIRNQTTRFCCNAASISSTSSSSCMAKAANCSVSQGE